RVELLLQRMLGPDAKLPEWPALDWRWNFLALRTLARHLKGKRLKRGRSECLPVGQALAIQREYVRQLCVVPVPPLKPSKVIIVPSKDRELFWPGKPFGTTAVAFHIFWQFVFWNMLGEDKPVCQGCGEPFKAKTDTGRKCRRTLCDNCNWKKWRAKQSTKAMQKRWLDDKAKQKKTKQKLKAQEQQQ